MASDTTLIVSDSEDSSLQDSETENGFLNTGLIDDSSGLSFENINGPDPVFKLNDFEDILSDNASSRDDNLSTVVVDEIEEEEILVSIDII